MNMFGGALLLQR